MEFRLKNTVQEGNLIPYGASDTPFICQESKQGMLANPQYDTALTESNQGHGIAASSHWQDDQSLFATTHVRRNSKMNLSTDSVDIGGDCTPVIALETDKFIELEPDR